jgi:hypothetical protein
VLFQLLPVHNQHSQWVILPGFLSLYVLKLLICLHHFYLLRSWILRPASGNIVSKAQSPVLPTYVIPRSSAGLTLDLVYALTDPGKFPQTYYVSQIFAQMPHSKWRSYAWKILWLKKEIITKEETFQNTEIWVSSKDPLYLKESMDLKLK